MKNTKQKGDRERERERAACPEMKTTGADLLQANINPGGPQQLLMLTLLVNGFGEGLEDTMNDLRTHKLWAPVLQSANKEELGARWGNHLSKCGCGVQTTALLMSSLSRYSSTFLSHYGRMNRNSLSTMICCSLQILHFFLHNNPNTRLTVHAEPLWSQERDHTDSCY